jgi:type IV secretion system protein VirB4
VKASSFANYIPYAGIIDDGYIVCKDGTFIHAFSVTPYDLTYQDDTVGALYLRNITNFLRLLTDDSWVICVDFSSRQINELNIYCTEDMPTTTRIFETNRKNLLPFYSTEVNIVLCKKPLVNQKKFSKLIFRSDTGNSDFEKEFMNFQRTCEDIGNMLKSTFKSAEHLNDNELLTYLHSTFSDTFHPVTAPDIGFYLDYFLSDATIMPDVVTKYNDSFVGTISLHLFPASTHTDFISTLATLPMVFRVFTSFSFLNKEAVKRIIKNDRRIHFKRRKSLVGHMTDGQLEDTEAMNQVNDASSALGDLSDSYINYGHLACTLVLMDKDYENLKESLSQIKTFVQNSGYICKIETLNNPLAYLGAIPGNFNINPKKFLLSTKNLSHFFPISLPWEGSPYDRHLYNVYKDKYEIEIKAPFISAITAYGRRPFCVNFDYNGCGHSLVIGPTGSGKSVFLNFAAIAALKYPHARVIYFDKDRTCEIPCRNTGGIFLEFNDSPDTLCINPFYDIESKEIQSQIAHLIKGYLAAKNITITPQDELAIFRAVEDLAQMPEETRGFDTFANSVQDEDIRAALRPFIDGEHSSLFKSGKDNLIDSKWISFEMNWLMQNKPPEIIEFVINYLFIKILQFLDGNFTLIPMDESWLFIKNPVFCSIIEDMLRTFRKKNAYVILTTQNIDDAHNSPIFSTILNACYTKILLPNPRAARPENIEFYRSMDLNDSDIYFLERTAKTENRNYFFVNPGGKQMFDLNLCQDEIDILKKNISNKKKGAENDLTVL